jgi:hypothetical protein
MAKPVQSDLIGEPILVQFVQDLNCVIQIIPRIRFTLRQPNRIMSESSVTIAETEPILSKNAI